MSLTERVRRVRAILVAGVALRAAGWAAFAALSLLAAAAIVDYFAALSLGTREILLAIALIGGLATFVALLWRDRRVLSLDRVALWIEEQHPSLRYTLVSALELRDDRLVAATDAGGWPGIAGRRSARGVVPPLAAMLVAVLIVLLLPSGAVARLRAPRAGDALERATRRSAGASRLSPLVVKLEPPAYTGETSRTLDEPSAVRALSGSTLRIEGLGGADGVTAVVGKDTLRATASGDRWAIDMRVGAEPAAIRLGDRDYRRLIALEPIADEAPVITLTSPARDSVLREARGSIALAADATDDFGLASASFEYIVSSGEGETFTFKSGTIGAVNPNAKHASLSGSLPLERLGLKPGDIVHIRAVARDANVATGPSVGASETRSIRIARADEYDSLAVDAAAPSEADKSALSERMLITLAEALEQRRRALPHDTVVRESRAIAVDQKKLRGTVSEIIFGKTDSATSVSADPLDVEDTEGPMLAVNKPLLEAYNAMWDASTALELGEPATALPHMRRALAAIQRARQAERVYLRGRPPQVVLDLSKIRLKGRDTGSPATRHPLGVLDAGQRALGDRFLRAMDVARTDARSAADSLLLLRIDALSVNPAFAAALGDAADAIRRGRSGDADAALVRARRALAGLVVARDSIARWGIVP